MKWTEQLIRNTVLEMAEENPFACKALLNVSTIRFSRTVPTLAVSLEAQPVLYINPEFCDQWLESDNDLKCILMHEFLHVLLRHTEKYTFSTPLLNIAADAIINAIIHRTYGTMYSDFFYRFYQERGLMDLLRYHNTNDMMESDMAEIHKRIYSGQMSTDELHELLHYMISSGLIRGIRRTVLIGNHEGKAQRISPETKYILDEIMKKMDGVLVWNKQKEKGIGDQPNHEEGQLIKHKLAQWRKSSARILIKCLSPDKKPRPYTDRFVQLPLLSNEYKRAMARYCQSGILPFSQCTVPGLHQSESVSLYLDVSGSMHAELDALIGLLHHFRHMIRRPIWVFSDAVYPAKFIKHKLQYITTNGTSIDVVFDHMRTKKISKALIVTDGYIRKITPDMLQGIDIRNVKAIVSADGNTSELNRIGIHYHQLNPLS